MPDRVFTERFNIALEKSRVPQKDLAKVLGINPSNIARYKQGTSAPRTMKQIKSIALVLGCSPMWLAGLTDDEANPELERKDIIRNKIEARLENMEEADMEKVLSFIEMFM